MAGRPQSYESMLYHSIAEELSDPNTTLADLDKRAVRAAKAWAVKNHKKWPPRPRTTGWQVTIISMGGERDDASL